MLKSRAHVAEFVLRLFRPGGVDLHALFSACKAEELHPVAGLLRTGFGVDRDGLFGTFPEEMRDLKCKAPCRYSVILSWARCKTKGLQRALSH